VLTALRLFPLVSGVLPDHENRSATAEIGEVGGGRKSSFPVAPFDFRVLTSFETDALGYVQITFSVETEETAPEQATTGRTTGFISGSSGFFSASM